MLQSLAELGPALIALIALLARVSLQSSLCVQDSLI